MCLLPLRIGFKVTYFDDSYVEKPSRVISDFEDVIETMDTDGDTPDCVVVRSTLFVFSRGSLQLRVTRVVGCVLAYVGLLRWSRSCKRFGTVLRVFAGRTSVAVCVQVAKDADCICWNNMTKKGK